MQLLPYEMNVQLLHDNAKYPEYATDGSGAMDLFAATGRYVAKNVVEYDLGFAIELPKDYSLLILSRSGHGFKQQTRLTNCVGLIDSDYRGSIKVQLIADSVCDVKYHDTFNYPIELFPTKAVAQGFVVYTPKVKIYKVTALTETARGTGGFGSTDKQKGITE
jgi:dUTP pyrophosphatase